MSIIDTVLAPVKAKMNVIKWILIGAGVISALVLGAYFWHDYKQTQASLIKANAELVTRRAENKDLQVTIDKKEASDNINEKVQLKVIQEMGSVEKTTGQITTEHLTKLKDIEKKYEQLPKTPDNEKAKMDEISADRLTRLWEVYCIANPSEARCSQPHVAMPIASSASKP